MDQLTNSGWTAMLDLESVLLQIRLALLSQEPRPARLQRETGKGMDHTPAEAVEAFVRACRPHRWVVPDDLKMVASMSAGRGV